MFRKLVCPMQRDQPRSHSVQQHRRGYVPSGRRPATGTCGTSGRSLPLLSQEDTPFPGTKKHFHSIHAVIKTKICHQPRTKQQHRRGNPDKFALRRLCVTVCETHGKIRSVREVNLETEPWTNRIRTKNRNEAAARPNDRSAIKMLQRSQKYRSAAKISQRDQTAAAQPNYRGAANREAESCISESASTR